MNEDFLGVQEFFFDISSFNNEDKKKYIIEKCKHALENYNWIKEIFLVFRITMWPRNLPIPARH